MMKVAMSFLFFSFVAHVEAMRNDEEPVESSDTASEFAPYQLPLKPQRTTASTNRSFEALVQIDNDTKVVTHPKSCTNDWMTNNVKIGQGMNGKITEVWRAGDRQLYAMKVPLTPAGKEDIVNERAVMEKAKTCSHVMHVIDSFPCLLVNNHLFVQEDSYVSPKEPGDLHGWLQKNYYNRTKIRSCGATVAEQLNDGLLCLHRSGYVHGDFKADNVFYEAINSTTGCPVGLRLADFGLSHPWKSMQDTYSAKYFKGSGHLPDGMFDVKEDTLGLRTADKTFRMSRSIDWCAFSFMMQKSFGMSLSTLGFAAVREQYCGKMGVERPYDIYGNTRPTFAWDRFM